MLLSRLSPARRRFYLTLIALAVLVVAVPVGVHLARSSRQSPAAETAQDRLGPVLLVPGYGGSTSALDQLAGFLRARGRDVEVVAPVGDGTGDLRDQADAVRLAATGAITDGAPSVDVVGYSAGGIAVRYWVARLGGATQARRVVTLSSPNHGTDLAALAGGVAPDACPTACQQLAPESDLLRDLDRGDETPTGPLWAALWTTDDQTVVPPTSGRLDGAVDFSVQQVCPGLQVAHGQMPSTPPVQAMVAAQLGVAPPSVPDASVCAAAGG